MHQHLGEQQKRQCDQVADAHDGLSSRLAGDSRGLRESFRKIPEDSQF